MSFCLSHVHYFDLDSKKRSIPEAGRYRDDRTVDEILPSRIPICPANDPRNTRASSVMKWTSVKVDHFNYSG